jgi:hypothetical protein
MEDGCYEYCIYNNGYWEAGCDTFEKGYYIMQKNEVKLVVVRYMPDLTDGEWYTAKPNDHDSVRILKINERAGTLGGMAKKFEYGVGYVHPYMHNITDFRKHSQEIAKEVSA